MKDREDILAHVEDIWRKTEERGIVRNSPFLSERERGLFLEKIKRERVSRVPNIIAGPSDTNTL